MTHPSLLDQPAIYHIRVEGRLSPRWAATFAGLQLSDETQPGGAPILRITGRFADQAALQGTLQALYNLGCVLISVLRES